MSGVYLCAMFFLVLKDSVLVRSPPVHRFHWKLSCAIIVTSIILAIVVRVKVPITAAGTVSWCYIDVSKSKGNAAIWWAMYAWVAAGLLVSIALIAAMFIVWCIDQRRDMRAAYILLPALYVLLWGVPLIHRTVQTLGHSSLTLAELHAVLGPARGLVNLIGLYLVTYISRGFVISGPFESFLCLPQDTPSDGALKCQFLGWKLVADSHTGYDHVDGNLGTMN